MTRVSCAIPQLNEAVFDAEVLGSALPVFLHFAGRDCEGCEMARRCLVDTMAQAHTRLKCFCIQGQKGLGVSARYGVSQYPTMLVFRGGRVSRRLVGHPLPGELEVILRSEFP